MSVLYLLGDSTCAIKKDEARPETGWGEMFDSFVALGWSIDNRALNGRSTKSFISEGIFDDICNTVKAGDAALIQFGHNDSKLDIERYSAPYTDYVANLVYMANSLKSKGVDVYFLTSIARRQFDERNIIKQTHGEYPSAMHYAAFLSGIPCVDMTIATMVELQEIGEKESRDLFMNLSKGEYENYPEGKQDNTHLTPKGAKWISSLIAKELSKLSPRPLFLSPEVKSNWSVEDVSKLEVAN